MINKQLWPLRTALANDFEYGLKIIGNLDARGFITWTNETREEHDLIKVYVSDPEYDSGLSTLEIPYYTLLPCEKIVIFLRLEWVQLMNREGSPCRTDYPPQVASIFKSNFTSSQLFSAIHAPKLPYDKGLCVYCRNSKIVQQRLFIDCRKCTVL